MEAIAIIIGFVVVAVVYEAGRYLERRDWRAERSTLMDRIMARNYEEYAEIAIRQTEAQEPVRVVSLDELKLEIIPREQGIPI